MEKTKYKKLYNDHDKDKLLKRCPFCNGKAKLRSPTRLRKTHSAICSDVMCTKCGVMKASYPWSLKDLHDPRELPREVQDAQVIKEWNKRKQND